MTLALGITCLALTWVQTPSRSAGPGMWSNPNTWEDHRVPAAGNDVLIRGDHRVTYDISQSTGALRSVHIAGDLIFATDRSTDMDVGWLVLQSDESALDESHLVMHHAHATLASEHQPLLQIGTPEAPLPVRVRARIRLRFLPGMDPNISPMLLSMGGRVEIHGAPLVHTWVKLNDQAPQGARSVTLMEMPVGWRVGDRVIITSTGAPKFFNDEIEAGGTPANIVRSLRGLSETEERVITAVRGTTVQFAEPLAFLHRVHGDYRGEVGNLSRNIVIESADSRAAQGHWRGHTMFHTHSPTSLSYVELRHLGKRNVLGRYAVHFHQVMDTVRGSSVQGCSIWDSDNRWLTIHGTEYLVVRDNVGYQSVGHGFFFEDSTESYNILDHNLAVGSYIGDPLPDQVLGGDHNDGANYWWANSLQVFTRNIAVEGDQYGFRFESFVDPRNGAIVQPVRTSTGARVPIDTRTLPFIRFAHNEARAQRRFGLNLGGMASIAGWYQGTTHVDGDQTPTPDFTGGTVEGAGPDFTHPFIVRDLRVWTTQWPVHAAAQSVMIDGLNMYDCLYGIWRPNAHLQEYRNIRQEGLRAPTVYQPWGGTPTLQAAADEFLAPKDDFPPFTVVTQVHSNPDGTLYVRGSAADNVSVASVRVNDIAARSLQDDFAEWEAVLPRESWENSELVAKSFDQAGHEERTPHTINLTAEPYVARRPPATRLRPAK